MAKLDIRRELEVVERLKQVAADFAKREERMTRALEVRRGGIEWRYQTGTSGDAEGETGTLAEIERDFDSREAHAREVAKSREKRVHRVSDRALRTLPIRAKEMRGNWLARLQMQMRAAEATQTRELAAAEEEAVNVATALTEEWKKMVRVKRETRGLLTGYGGFRKRLSAKGSDGTEPPGGAEGLKLVSEAIAEAEARLEELKKLPAPRAFQYLPPAALCALGLLAGGGLAAAMHFSPVGDGVGGVLAVLVLGGALGAQAATKGEVGKTAIPLTDAVVKAERLYEAVRQRGNAAHEQAQAAIQEKYQKTHDEISGRWSEVDEIEKEFQVKAKAKLEKQAPRILGKIKAQLDRRLAALGAARPEALERVRAGYAARRAETQHKYEMESAQWIQEEKQEWETLVGQWKAEVEPIYEEIRAIHAEAGRLFPEWSEEWIEQWTPPRDFPHGAKFADLDIDVKQLAGALPKDPRLALPGPAAFSLPLTLSFPNQGSLLFEAKESGQAGATAALNSLILRLLTVSPPGKASFTIIDPVGLGQNFAGLMYLADYEETLINRRIWTQQSQIEERLAELNEHIEKVIQMYLRNEYATISEYNEKAGSVAEKYHFLVIADFPAQFSETAARRLQSIATSGARCGVFTLIQWDQRMAMPEGLAVEELRKSSIAVHRRAAGYYLPGLQPEAGAVLRLEAPPEAELAAKVVHRTGQASVDSNRVEVPFAQISPAPAERWTNETAQELKIAIGRTGATKPQYLSIGKGTRQHALFAGKTGSGKSTLFHVIITNLALACSPSQVEFYLIDFKKGVEFKCYAEKRLPHARVVAIESDREFALSVLQRVDEELRRRGDLFRKLGVQDVAGYKRAGGTEEIPRTLLIIDEFQEFFVEDDAIAQNASLLFDRIVRQGRAFGIHALLGSQTLGGAYTLARATLGQMVIRVALQCNEADAYLIMDDNNPAPRLLSRPGEGIYNDAAGAVEGNSPFQVVWLADDERDRLLDEIHELAEARGVKSAGPIVFEGNAPADIRENAPLRGVLEKAPAKVPEVGRIWLGAPNSIKGPTEAVFHRQSGNNLLVVGQREEAALSILGAALMALGAEYPAGGARFVFLQGAADGYGPEFIDGIAKSLPHEVTVVGPHEAGGAINQIATELKERMSSGAYGAGPIYLLVNGLQKFKKLRHEDDFSFSAGDSGGDADPGAQFDEIIREGSAYGIHLLLTVDAYSNVTRFMSRKGITEFEMRVVFQMSANDSASLIDSPNASNLGLHRALFFNEREGTLETFRPYALPAKEWLEEAEGKLRVRKGKASQDAKAQGKVTMN